MNYILNKLKQKFPNKKFQFFINEEENYKRLFIDCKDSGICAEWGEDDSLDEIVNLLSSVIKEYLGYNKKFQWGDNQRDEAPAKAELENVFFIKPLNTLQEHFFIATLFSELFKMMEEREKDEK